MALRSLSNTAMAEVAASCLDPTRLGRHFTSEPLLTALVPAVEAAHAAVTSLVHPSPVTDLQRELTDLAAEGTDVDAQHDRLVRGIHRTLEGASELAETPEEAVAFRALSARLLPAGLATMQQSWLGQSGNTRRLESELADDPTFVAALHAVPIPGSRTLYAVVQSLVALGQRLGDIEVRRAALRAQLSPDEDRAPESRSVLGARGMWVSTFSLLRDTLSLPYVAVGEDARVEILGALRAVESAAEEVVSPVDRLDPIDPIDPPVAT